MKRLIVAVLFLSLSEVTYAQDNILLIQLVPTTLNTKVSTSELELLATKISGRNIISGIVSDGSGIVIIETNERTTSLKLDPFKVIISPLTVQYNVLEKVLQKEQSLSGTFIQYNTNITKFNVQQVPVLQHTHDNYLKKLKKTGSVLFEGYFDNDDGGIMIMEGKVADQVITLDPTIQSGFMNDIITEVKIYKH